MKRQFLYTVELPDWARWYAIDLDGEVWVYGPRPHKCFHGKKWDLKNIDIDSDCMKIMKLENFDRDWTKTLHRIPRAA